MITITLQPRTPAHLDAALALLQRIRDDEAAADAKFSELFRGAATETMADALPVDTPTLTEPGADEDEQPTVEPKVMRKRKSPAPEATAPVSPPPPPPPPPASEPDGPAVTLVDLRAKLAALSREGHAEAVKTLLADYGAAKLTDLSESDYPAVMDRAEAIV